MMKLWHYYQQVGEKKRRIYSGKSAVRLDATAFAFDVKENGTLWKLCGENLTGENLINFVRFKFQSTKPPLVYFNFLLIS